MLLRFKQKAIRRTTLFAMPAIFRPLRLDIPTVSLLQDPIVDAQQIQVCKDSDLVITNSPYTEHILRSYVPSATSQMIPLGVDFDFFKPCPVKTQMDILPNSILFVGAANPFKGFELLKQLIDTTNYNFCLVVKDDTTIEHKRCRVYNRVGQEEIRDIYNSCSMLICLSSIETQHLATIEAGACGIPVVTTNVGINYNYPSGPWGENVDSYAPSKIREAINLVMNNLDKYNPRHILLDRGLHTPACKKQWVKLCKKY